MTKTPSGRPIDPERFVCRSWDQDDVHCTFVCAGQLVVVAAAGRRRSNNEPKFRERWLPLGRPVLTEDEEAVFNDRLRIAKLDITRRLMELGRS